MKQRRRTDLKVVPDRRQSAEDRRTSLLRPQGMRYPQFQEQLIQFLTRYLFALLGWIFFTVGTEPELRKLSLMHINWIFGSYIVVNTLYLIHAWRQPFCAVRYRLALWTDIIMVSGCSMFDPNNIPPSILAYIAVVLGNGMRYGMRLFAEAVAGTLIGGSLVAMVRYGKFADVFTPGALFLSLFGVIIVLYAYILMGRIEQARHRSEMVSRTDPLTGLLNRRGLSHAAAEWLEEAKGDARKLVVMLADLDHFKTVNDRHGHAEGDRVLIKVADMLMANTREEDIVARYGGDEFVLLLPDTDGDAAQHIAVRVQSMVEGWMRDKHLTCGISIGVSETTAAELELDAVLESVDRLLYQAKSKRGSRGASVQVAT